MIRFRINDMTIVKAAVPTPRVDNIEAIHLIARTDEGIIVQRIVQQGSRIKEFSQVKIDILPKGSYVVEGEYLYIIDSAMEMLSGILKELFGALPSVSIDDPKDRKDVST